MIVHAEYVICSFLMWFEIAFGFSAATMRGGGGGRASGQPDRVGTPETWEATPNQASEARLIILQITDVYTLEHLASFKTLLEETRKKSGGAKVICMLTGDFLSPYLLSGVDRGSGMMKALGKIPLVSQLNWFYSRGCLVRWKDPHLITNSAFIFAGLFDLGQS
jgi:hypothetical protein